MAHYKSLNAKLSNSQVNELEPVTENATEVTL